MHVWLHFAKWSGFHTQPQRGGGGSEHSSRTPKPKRRVGQSTNNQGPNVERSDEATKRRSDEATKRRSDDRTTKTKRRTTPKFEGSRRPGWLVGWLVDRQCVDADDRRLQRIDSFHPFDRAEFMGVTATTRAVRNRKWVSACVVVGGRRHHLRLSGAHSLIHSLTHSLTHSQSARRGGALTHTYIYTTLNSTGYFMCTQVAISRYIIPYCFPSQLTAFFQVFVWAD